MDLKKLNLVELNSIEVREVEGGRIPQPVKKWVKDRLHDVADFFFVIADGFKD